VRLLHLWQWLLWSRSYQYLQERLVHEVRGPHAVQWRLMYSWISILKRRLMSPWISKLKQDFLKLKLIYDRRSVGQSVLLPGSHLESMTWFIFSDWRLRVSCCGARNLTRGWFCTLLSQLLLGLSRAISLGTKSLKTQTTFYCFIWDSPTWRAWFPY
jgi:hypothetical protein